MRHEFVRVILTFTLVAMPYGRLELTVSSDCFCSGLPADMGRLIAFVGSES